jgi:hypothetical protein
MLIEVVGAVLILNAHDTPEIPVVTEPDAPFAGGTADNGENKIVADNENGSVAGGLSKVVVDGGNEGGADEEDDIFIDYELFTHTLV